jgi:1-acyl-sn-glycerol-3-phosphate acyltransferase
MSKLKTHDLNLLKSQWANEMLRRLKVQVEVVGVPTDARQVLFVGNHISYLDIPVLMSKVNSISFVAKSELQSWPILGAAAKKANTIFVKRGNLGSAKSAMKTIEQALANGMRIGIFPSGTTTLDENKSWRRGSFEIAAKTNSYIQPFRISYKPLRAVAYIDQDFFPTHLYNLFYYGLIEAKIEFHNPVKVENPAQDAIKWHYWSRGLIDA